MINPRAFREDLADEFTDPHIRALAAAAATALALLIVALAAGQALVVAALAGICVWLIGDRAQLLDRCDQATDTADRALANRQEQPVQQPEPQTEPIPAQPPTEPSDLPLQVHTALLEDDWRAKWDQEIAAMKARWETA